MRESLILPMMMFGRFRRERAKRDENGKTIIKGYYKNGKPKYAKEKYWLVHSEKDGDKGVYPSVNEIYVRMHKGRQRYSEPAMRLFDKWQVETRMWMDKVNWKTTNKEKVIVELTAYFPNDKIRRDVSNVLKMLPDAFTGLIYDDDEYSLPRVMDFHHVEEGQKPYFKLDIYLKSEEDEVFMRRMAEGEDK